MTTLQLYGIGKEIRQKTVAFLCSLVLPNAGHHHYYKAQLLRVHMLWFEEPTMFYCHLDHYSVTQ